MFLDAYFNQSSAGYSLSASRIGHFITGYSFIKEFNPSWDSWFWLKTDWSTTKVAFLLRDLCSFNFCSTALQALLKLGKFNCSFTYQAAKSTSIPYSAKVFANAVSKLIWPYAFNAFIAGLTMKKWISWVAPKNIPQRCRLSVQECSMYIRSNESDAK